MDKRLNMRIPALFLCTALFLGVLQCSHHALASEPIKRHKLTIGKLRKEMDTQSAKIKQSDQKQANLLDELSQIDDKIAQQQEKVLSIQDKISEQIQLIEAKQVEIESINEEKKALQQHLEKRLRAYYLMGKNGFLSIAFSREALPDLLVFNDSFHSLVTYDHNVFMAYQERKNTILQVQKAHELEKSVLEGFLQRAEEERKTLQYIADKKNDLLKKAKTEKGLYELALKEMKKSEEDLNGQIEKLKQKEEQKNKGFLLSKGKLHPPVKGSLLTRFGEKKSADGQENTMQKGITLKIRDGAKVHAIYRGKVIFTGYTRGYGRTVIIDHGYNYFTVTSRLESIQVKQGDQVQQDQVIATTGDIATLFGRGLYFEVRKGSSAEDPMIWFQAGALSEN